MRSLIQLRGLLFPLLLTFGMGFANAGDIAECDRLAASPLDDDRVSEAVSWEDLDGEAGIAACSNLTSHMESWSLRIMFQLARSYLKTNDVANATIWLSPSAMLGYGTSGLMMGDMLEYGKYGTRINKSAAIKRYRVAAKSGNKEAKKRLSIIDA